MTKDAPDEPFQPITEEYDDDDDVGSLYETDTTESELELQSVT